MPVGDTRAVPTVKDSQGAFVAGITRRTVRRTFTFHFETARRRAGPSGLARRWALELWRCTPAISGTHVSRGRCWRKRRHRSPCKRCALRAALPRRGGSSRVGCPSVAPHRAARRQQPDGRSLSFAGDLRDIQQREADPARDAIRDDVRGFRVAEPRVGSVSRTPLTRWCRGDSPSAGASLPEVIFGSPAGEEGRSTGDASGDDVRGASVAETRVRPATQGSLTRWFRGGSLQVGPSGRKAVFTPLDGWRRRSAGGSARGEARVSALRRSGIGQRLDGHPPTGEV